MTSLAGARGCASTRVQKAAGHGAHRLTDLLTRPVAAACSAGVVTVLDDATVARIIRVHQDQADDLMLFQNQAGKWNAVPGLTPAQRAAVWEYEAAIGELRRLNAEVLAAAEQLKPVTIEALLARSDLEAGIKALLRGWPGKNPQRNGHGR